MLTKTGRILTELTCVAAIAGCATTTQAPAAWDGLERRDVKGIDTLYVRPNVTFPHYQKVILDPLQVSFSKNWDPNASADFSRRVDSADIQKIKDALATMFREEYVKELAKGGYVVTDVAGEDTIRVTPAIINLYISAPDVMTAGRSRTYTTDAGQMTLDVEVRDSVTGQLMARAVDKQQAIDTGRLQWTNSVTNRADAQRAIDVWAKQLRAGLDRVNGVGKTP